MPQQLPIALPATINKLFAFYLFLVRVKLICIQIISIMPNKYNNKTKRRNKARFIRKRRFRTKRMALNNNYNIQHGGNNLLNNKLEAQVIMEVINADTSLLANIKAGLALAGTTPTDLNKIIDNYRKQLAGLHLYDLIYPAPANNIISATTGKLTAPGLIWDHLVNNPDSITAGKPGLHIYVVASTGIKNNKKKYLLAGIFNRLT